MYDTGARFADATQDFKFASAVAAFGMVLRDSPHKGTATLTEIEAWRRAGIGRTREVIATNFSGWSSGRTGCCSEPGNPD